MQIGISQKSVAWNHFTFNIPEQWKAEENFLKTFQIYRLFDDSDKQNWLMITIKEQKGNNLDTLVQQMMAFVKDDTQYDVKKSERYQKNNAQIHHLAFYNKTNTASEFYNFIEYNEKMYRQSFAFLESSPKQFVEEGIAIFNSIGVESKSAKEPILKSIIKAPKRILLKMYIRIVVARKMAKIFKKIDNNQIQNTENQYK